MKKLQKFTDIQKIKIFDELWKKTLEEFNNHAKDEAHDNIYFWEAVMELVLEINNDDWNKHNEGKILK